MPKSTTPTARERELFKYYQPLEISDLPTDDHEQTSPSSSDPCLTAFAQLGALRLNAGRGLITLSSRHSEYILAESGKTLLLQDEDDEQDRLWHGSSTIAANTGLGLELVRLFSDPETAPTHVVVSDAAEDDRFKQYGVVKGRPFVRFMAAVPLRTPSSIVIGNYIVVDDRPRPGLSEKEIQFLIDVGVTVMDYLEAARVSQKEYRAQRMVKAVGLFIEGKSTLRDWWLQEGQYGQKARIKRRSRNLTSADGNADSEFGVQDPPDAPISDGAFFANANNHRDTLGRLERSPSSSTISQVGPGDGRPMVPRTSSSGSTSLPLSPGTATTLDRHSSVTTLASVDGPSNGTGTKHYPLAFDNPEADESRELQEALLSNDLRNIFSRASNLIREARRMDGTIFFDASVSSFGASAQKVVMEQKAPRGFSIDGVLSDQEADLVCKTSDTDGSTGALTPPESVGNYCNILGYSTRNRSSLRGHAPPKESQTFPESVLRRLLKRYPHGTVFNFDEDDPFSSGQEYSDKTPKHSYGAKLPEIASRRKRHSREMDAAAIRSALPGARSVFWFPLWDQGRDRWYAGSMVWSTCPSKSLCPTEDLTYSAAFGNCIMAEVARLSAQVLAQMKNDFISSISHELRSPLHGVLASVEFLQETSMTETQAEMVDNIHASGKVLLDTINHVLDFSKVNRKSKNKIKSGRKKLGRRKKSGLGSKIEEAATEETADICVLSEEVVESIYAGRNASKLISDASASRRKTKNSPAANASDVTVIMEIDWRPNWTFAIDAGAWRRILMNLFSNAMKYTTLGFIKVSLRLDEDSDELDQRCQPVLTLQVKDSGKGISKEFLQNNLYKPFTQEDSLATGTGLGLSIVSHIIHDLGGQISFASEQGCGTEVTVRIPLLAPRPSEGEDAQDVIEEVRRRTTGMKVSFDGFDRLPDISETPTGILSPEAEGAMLLQQSIKSLLENWFSMDTKTSTDSASSNARVDVLMESGIASMENKLQSYTWQMSSEPMVVIILCSSPPKSKIRSNGFFQVYYIQQPYGPRKMAKLLHNVFCTNNTPLSSPPALQQNGVRDFTEVPLRQESNGAQAVQPQISDRRDFAQSVKSPHQTKSLQAAPQKANGIVSTSQQIDLADDDNLHVLLVEDNAINLKLLVAYMRKLKLRHGTACNGLEAVNIYKESHQLKPFDVIFMDISMPIMDGIEATKHIRRHENENRLQPCVIIALTGAANPEARQEAFSCGVDLFLTKPVPMKDLKVMLEEVKRTGREGLVG